MKAKFITFGCRLNQYDSEWLREEFELAGFDTFEGKEDTPSSLKTLPPRKDISFKGVPSKARLPLNTDICVINSCAVTSRACREARNTIRTEAKRTPKSFIIVTGCYAKISPAEISQINGVDLIEHSPKKIVTDFLKVPLLPGIRKVNARDKAFVKVQEGCDQFCSYCIVPYARGKPQQRPLKKIINEINNLVRNGYNEIILTGTNLGKCQNLLQIIEAVDKVGGVHRIGLGSLEPIGISDELLDFVQSAPKFARYFHIPLQSGDNKILKLMGRWYSREEYIELLYKIKERIPDCAIGADVIVGFPGEGEQEFLNTYDLVLNAPISRLHVFRYSKRPYTRALGLPNEPPDSVKKERCKTLLKVSEEKWEEFRSQFIDKILEAHIESHCFPRSSEFWNGWQVGVTKNYIKVLFKSLNSLTQTFVELRIKGIDGPRTYGELKQRNKAI